MASLRPNGILDPTAIKMPLPMNSLGAMTNNTILSPPTVQTGTQFTKLAPNSSANTFGDFTAPDPASLASDPYTQFRLSEGQRGMEHSAAAKGTLLSGGLLRSLERYRQGVASEEGQNLFNRSLAAYNANRDTNAQNFDQAHTTYQDQLDAFRANRNGTPAGTSTPGSQALEPGPATTGPLVYGPSLGDDYDRQVQAARMAALAPPPPPRAPTNYLPFRYREARPGGG